MSIFVITTLRGALADSQRSVGYVNTFEEAEGLVLENAYDIYEEGYYPFAVIEETEPGIYPLPKKEYWYRWNNSSHAYEKLEQKPERFQKVICFGLG